ncbi:hypothetical protein [Micromonospora sp. 4G55]|uniref:hypothetical protein n=1 Tax=Micromonospora sp. 4G55 TaxID=2806102 RepID=UPI001A4B5D6A|nr:hypothetical protein [Micromonospora sp. 4G55]MBM0255765.1 hypothetical protein [Micromonospora sp. 4G55]MBM0257899.1 hypothetical protein [Micromonospora sp. 4G55]
MSCSTLIGVTASGGAYAVRWLHWGGDPAQMLPQLRRIWRHTFDRRTLATGEALLRHDWLTLDYPRHPGRGGQRPVPGVGVTAGLQDGIRRGRVDDPIAGYLEWMYLIDVATDTVVVYEATCHGRWLRHSRHLLDPDSGGRLLDPDSDARVLGCGGYRTHGHRWHGCRLWLPDARTGLDAEICLAPHLGTATVLRFSDATAGAITAATAPTTLQAGRQAPWLRPVGPQFDLVMPGSHGERPYRLRRDADGLLLLDVPVPGWSWQLLSAQVTRR